MIWLDNRWDLIFHLHDAICWSKIEVSFNGCYADVGTYFVGNALTCLLWYQTAKPVAAINPAPTAAPIITLVCDSKISGKML